MQTKAYSQRILNISLRKHIERQMHAQLRLAPLFQNAFLLLNPAFKLHLACDVFHVYIGRITLR